MQHKGSVALLVSSACLCKYMVAAGAGPGAQEPLTVAMCQSARMCQVSQHFTRGQAIRVKKN